MIIPAPLTIADAKVTLRGTNHNTAQSVLAPDATTSYTLSAPTPQEGRKILLAASAGTIEASYTLDFSAIIGGVTATRLAQVSATASDPYGFALFVADVPTGTTVDVDLTVSNYTSVRAVAAFELFGLGVDFITSAYSTAAATTVSASASPLAGDFVFGFGYGTAAANQRGAGITFDKVSASGSVSRTYAYNTLSDSKWHMTTGTLASEVYRSVADNSNFCAACVMICRDKMR